MKIYYYSELTTFLKQLTLKNSNYFCFIVPVLFFLMVMIFNSQAHAVGFKWIVADDLKIGVWYPSPDAEAEGQLGPFDVTLAMDAEPETQGSYQVVLFSHGNLGRVRNHHLTAKALTEAGFLVIAPLHSADHLMAGDDIPMVLEWRATELRFALEAVIQDEKFRNIVDLSRIHALGFSLGGLTALNAAGASIDVPAAEEHCARYDDPAFCDKIPLFLRWKIRYLRKTTTPDLNREIAPKYFPIGFVNGNVAVVAPIGQAIGFEQNTFLAKRLMIFGLKDDKVTLPQYHAANLDDIFSGKIDTQYHLLEGHHSAFISPFAKRVTDVEDIPAAKDPDGFDRMEFLNNINGKLVDFFKQSAAAK